MRTHGAWITFRILSTITAVLVFDQAVFAGQFLAGSFGALHTHRDNATYSGLAALASALAGLVARWRGGGPWWPAVACAGLFALIAAQIAVGFARLLTVHIPLGVAIIALTVAICVRAWRTPQHRPSTTGRDTTEPSAAGPGTTSGEGDGRAASGVSGPDRIAPVAAGADDRAARS